MKSVHWMAMVALVAAAGCSGTERAANQSKEANQEVAEEKKDVQDAAAKLAEEEGELREAQADADAKATKLGNEIAKDTTVRKNPQED